uniref:Tumor necrosis factor ligand superfamily member 10 n=1 Tax=Canis lupus familiaris TaxID=9615 RepID=A0A8C0SMV6_CANLF
MNVYAGVCGRNSAIQMQDKYSQSGIACFLKEDDIPWDPSDEESMNNPCWQVKWQLRQFVRKMILKTYEETIPTAPEKQLNIPYVVSDRGSQRVAAHITGTSRRSMFPIPSSKNDKALGHKINSWDSTRKGHSFLNNLHLRNGELVIHQRGFYYIYSQTYFRFQEPEEIPTGQNRKRNKQMVQYIYKHTSYPDPILLMKSARNSCWSKDSEYGLYSIYQAKQGHLSKVTSTKRVTRLSQTSLKMTKSFSENEIAEDLSRHYQRSVC